MALSPYMMRMMGSQMGGIAPGTISGLTQPMTLGVPAVQPLMGMAAMPAMGSGVPEDSMTKARRVIKEAMSDAPQGIDPDLAAILNQREARLAEQEKNIEDKGSVWDRLGRFSAALLANESPFFSVGLGRAVSTTLADEQRRREVAGQRREAIAQSREEIGMERVRQKGAGRAQAMEQLKTTISLAGDLSTQEKNELEGRLKRLELEQNPQKFAAEIAKINAEVVATKALTEERRTAAIKNLRPDSSGGKSDVEGRADRQELDKAAARYRGAAARFEALRLANPGSTMQQLREADQKTVDDYISSRSELEGYSGAMERRTGFTPYIGGRNPSAGPLSVGTVRPVASTTGSVIDFSKLNPR